MSRFHLYDWKELNFPVFTYKRSNNVLKTEVNNSSLELCNNSKGGKDIK